LYDQNFKVVYVGQTGGGEQRLLARLRQHRRDHLSQRWSRFSWFGILPVSTDGNLKAKFTPARPSTMSVLNHIEAIVIAVSEPPLNRQGGKFGETVKQYIQVSPAAKPADDDN
ncbi:MAG: GIY-YIG nuclease family protein, partial [Rhodospirillales bacterium]|nr:GIY-YIG nuclease family protein [Rhodospirillales bacterium]